MHIHKSVPYSPFEKVLGLILKISICAISFFVIYIYEQIFFINKAMKSLLSVQYIIIVFTLESLVHKVFLKSHILQGLR